jgi:glycosidase
MANPETTSHGIIRSDFPGGWDGDRKSAITGEGLSAREQEAQEFVRKILKWRREKKVIHSGMITHFRPENGTYVYFRHDEDDSVMVVINKNTEETDLELSRFSERLEGYRNTKDIVSGEVQPLGESLQLPANSAQIFDLQ